MPKSLENLQKFFGRARKSQRISKNFGNTSNPFLRSLNNLSKFWKIFGNLQKFLENFWNGPKWFQNFRKIFWTAKKFSENFGNCSKVFFRCCCSFFKFLENLWKCSKITRKFLDVIETVHNHYGLQELKSFWA